MTQQIRSIRGMHDLLPAQAAAMQFLERAYRGVMDAYGYQEIRVPILERTELFRRSIGEVTDIVEKEMYTFDDRSGDSLTLRPEGTAGCVRAGIEHGLIGNQPQRWWYAGPMFRYERPQKGRYRQFHQVGVEVFGLSGPDIDAELLLLTARLWRALGLRDVVRLEINSLGSPEARRDYRAQLTAYFEASLEQLDEDSRRRLHSNPLRILDSKNPAMQALIADAPRLDQCLDVESAAHFEQLRATLDTCGIEYRVNPRLVRGLDYYTRTVFEWVTDRLGAQGAVCAGGRYDGLIDQLGGKPTPGIGFAMGLERLLALMEEVGVAVGDAQPDLYLIAGQGLDDAALRLAEILRDRLPGVRLLTHCGGGSFKSQMKKADRSGAAYSLILGEQEHARQQVTVKPMLSAADQETLAQADLAVWLEQRLTL